MKTLRLILVLGFLTFLGLLLYGIFRPEPPRQFFEHSDKWMHTAALFVFVVWSRLVFSRVNLYLFAFVSLTFAASLEPLQGWLRASRVFSVEDLYANLGGALLGLVLVASVILVRRLSLFDKSS